jgi:hypothetical protein
MIVCIAAFVIILIGFIWVFRWLYKDMCRFEEEYMEMYDQYYKTRKRRRRWHVKVWEEK